MRLNETEVELSNGVKFTVVHDFENMEGPVNSFDAAFQSWLARTTEYTAESFVRYVKTREPKRIFVTKADLEATLKRSRDKFEKKITNQQPRP